MLWPFLICGAAFGGAAEYEAPEPAGTVRVEGLEEVSGIEASRRHAGLYWVHDDSGGAPRLHALREEGTLVAVVEVSGAKARDWEDIAMGPGLRREASYIYIADAGNNDRKRRDLCIYRIEEPAIDGAAAPEGLPRKLTSEPAEVFPFRYADGHHDCEAIAVDSRRPEVFLFTKQILGVGVYRLDAGGADRKPQVLERLTTLRSGSLATAAALSPDGKRLVLRFYYGIREYASPAAASVPELLKERPVSIRAPFEWQGEAICYSADGRAILTIGEGRNPVIYKLRRKEGKPAE
jgi:hypothetical protein